MSVLGGWLLEVSNEAVMDLFGLFLTVGFQVAYLSSLRVMDSCVTLF